MQATVRHDEAGRTCGLEIVSEVAAGQRAHRQKGAYLLRTNCEETDPALLWRWYVQDTQASKASTYSCRCNAPVSAPKCGCGPARAKSEM